MSLEITHMRWEQLHMCQEPGSAGWQISHFPLLLAHLGRGLSLGLRPGLAYNRQNFTPFIKVNMSGTVPTVQFFVTCLLDSLFPEVAQDIVTVLQRQGVQVELPAGQTCCGQPMFNGGFWPEARTAAAYTINLLSQTKGLVLIASGSCAALIKHEY